MQSQANRHVVRTKIPKTTGIYKRFTSRGETRYEFAYVDAEGRQRWGTTATLAEAKREREARRVKVTQGEVIPSTKVKFSDLAEEWLIARITHGRRPLRPRTADYYRRSLDLVLLPRFGRWPVAAIDADAIVRLTRDLERSGLHALHPSRPVRPLGCSSVENYLKPLHGVLALAVRRRIIATNPFASLTADDRPVQTERQRQHEWTAEEIDALLAASARLGAQPHARYDYSLLLRIAASLGLRLSEVLGLQWHDLAKEADGRAGVLRVERQWLPAQKYGPPKTKAGMREIPLPSAVWDSLIALRLRSRWSLEDQPVFASRVGSPLQHRNVVRRGFEPARDVAKLPPDLTFHSLRHAAASRLIHAGLDAVSVAAVLGHEDATTTLKVYAHLFDRLRTRDAVRKALAGTTSGTS